MYWLFTVKLEIFSVGRPYKWHDFLQMFEDSDYDSFLSADIASPISNGNETYIVGRSMVILETRLSFVASGDPNNFNRNILLAEACIRVWRPYGYVRLGL